MDETEAGEATKATKADITEADVGAVTADRGASSPGGRAFSPGRVFLSRMRTGMGIVVVVSAVGVGVGAYGLDARGRAQIDSLEATRAALTVRIAHITRHSEGLEGRAADGDLLDERARAVLGYVGPRDRVITVPPGQGAP